MTEKPQEIPLSGENEYVVFESTGHEYPISQLYLRWGDLRSGAELTRSQAIALAEHARFHAAIRDFGNNLQLHIDLMAKFMKNGFSFIESHVGAIRIGPKPL